MPLYRYKARDKSGMLITGLTEAENKKVLSYGLKDFGYQVVSIEEERGVRFFLGKFLERFRKIKTSEVVLFYRQVGVMLNSGLALILALASIAQQVKNPRLKMVIVEIIEDVKAGKSLSEAMQRFPQVFSGFSIGMVRAGEAGGSLGQILERLAAIGMEEIELRGRITSALVYPVMLVCVALAVVIFLLIGVLPKFIAIFEESGAQLPTPTIILLAISNFMRSFWFIVLGSIICLIILLRLYVRSFRGRYKFHNLLLKIPLFGDLNLKITIARFARTLGSLTKSGVPMLYALTIVQDVIKNVVVARVIENVRGAITGGENLSEPFRLSGVFPPIVTQLLAAGEKTGSIDEMLLSISDYYEREIGHSIRAMTSLLEPILLLVMGLIVGFIALSVLLPIFNLIKIFRG